jgi:hypothetical protein
VWKKLKIGKVKVTNAENTTMFSKIFWRYAKLVGPRIDQISAKQIEEEKQTSSGIYEQVLKCCCKKKTDSY